MQQFKWIALVVVSLLSTATFAQSKKQTDKMKQRLMTELKIDNVKADSVVKIVEDFYSNARAIKTSGDVKDDQRKPALQNNRKAEMVRLRAQLNPDQIKKLQQVMEEMKQEKQNRKGAKDSTSVH